MGRCRWEWADAVFSAEDLTAWRCCPVHIACGALGWRWPAVISLLQYTSGVLSGRHHDSELFTRQSGGSTYVYPSNQKLKRHEFEKAPNNTYTLLPV